MQAGISTLGVKLGYGTGSSKPSAFTQLGRITSIGGISLEAEQLDASCLEDAVTRYIAGRMDTGGSLTVTVNVTDETIEDIGDMITAYTGMTSGASMWFEVCSPYLTKAYFFVAQPPTVIPMPEMNGNEVMTVDLTLVIEEYKGLDTKIEPTA